MATFGSKSEAVLYVKLCKFIFGMKDGFIRRPAEVVRDAALSAHPC